MTRPTSLPGEGLESEGFRRVFVLKSPEEVEAVTIERERLETDDAMSTEQNIGLAPVFGCPVAQGGMCREGGGGIPHYV